MRLIANYFDLKSRRVDPPSDGAELGGWPQALVLEGIEAIVFRTVGDQCSLWESVLPEEVRRLGRRAEMAFVAPKPREPSGTWAFRDSFRSAAVDNRVTPTCDFGRESVGPDG